VTNPQRKSPARGGAFDLTADQAVKLLRHNVVGAWTFGALANFKRDFLTFSQSFETTALDGAEMDENVIAAGILGNEAETFRFIKPLNCTCSHSDYLKK
jgi:hypothetical protein